MNLFYKIVLILILGIGLNYVLSRYNISTSRSDTQTSLQQLNPQEVGNTRETLQTNHLDRTYLRVLAVLGYLLLSSMIFWSDIKLMLKNAGILSVILLCMFSTGCRKPFEPVKLEKIEPNEEAFLLPFTENPDKQTSTNTEEFFKKNMVFTQQVKIPQQWVQQGYESVFWNGEWRDAAILLRVDKSPVTREWTADPNSGTSNKNEAIWVMTSDQVEFSTGWTCTAKIQSRDDAVKFLYHYRNGSLEKVMDQEVRAKIQTEFGLEVTDLPMDTLRKQATPHIVKVVDSVKSFFAERGITITNLGITGGFVYKDPTIIETMVKVFNAEQQKSIAIAETQAQQETNKKIQLEADSKAKAQLTIKQAEADAIKAVADAKAYEMEKARENSETYMLLKRLELEKAKLEKWDGKFPLYFFGQGTQGLDLLLQTPEITSDGQSP